MKATTARTLGIAAGSTVLATFALAMWFAVPIASYWADVDGRLTGGLLGVVLAASAGAISAVPRRTRHRLAIALAIYAVHAVVLARLAGWRSTDDALAQALIADGVALGLVVLAGQRWSPRGLATLACFAVALWWLARAALNAVAPCGTPFIDLGSQDGLLFALGAVGRHLTTVWDAPDAPLPRATALRPCGPRSGAARG